MRPARRWAFGTLAGAALALAAAAAGAAEWLKAPLPVPRPTGAAPSLPPLPDPPSGMSGWMALDLDSGAVIDARNAGRGFAPASVAKLVTTFYALDRLGPEHRFVTRLLATGAVREGVLEGDLVLVGGGDPEFDSDELASLVAALEKAGVRRVAGRFIVDGTAAPQLPMIDAGQPVEAAYNPAVSGLSLNFNRVRLTWDARKGPAALRLSARAEVHDPEVSGVRVVLNGEGAGPPFAHALMGGSELWELAPETLRGRGGRWLPVRRPELYAGEVFAALAAAKGITVPAPEEGRAPAEAHEIGRWESRPLGPMLRGMLHFSTNLTAELVGLAASARDGPAAATLAESAARMNAWAAARVGTVAADFALANHSGLSGLSRVTPEALVRLIAAEIGAAPGAAPGAGPGAGPEARYPRLPAGAAQLLPRVSIAAENTKLDYARIELGAKSGTMDYVRGLAGVMVTPSGHRIAFAVFSNDLEHRAPGTSRIDRRWMGAARAFERALLRSWVRLVEG